MMTWGKPELHYTDDPYIAGLLTTKRQWERRSETAQAQKFWMRLCLFATVLIVAAIASTYWK